MDMRLDALAETRHPECRIAELSDGLSFVAASPAMLRVRAQVEQVARIEVPVLCLGESGTGKEVVARLLHRLSLRSHRPFLKVNCAGLPSEQLESELFGYETAAFTEPVPAEPGVFELCHQGTILLDEIVEMPAALQAKLLHVLHNQEIARLGGCSPIKTDFRVIATSNADVRTAIKRKRLREDLFYHLSTVVFHLPPLRERREDVPVLLDFYLGHFAQRYGLPRRELSKQMIEACLNYDWPGNVRELQNFVKRHLIVGGDTRGWCESAPNQHPRGQQTDTPGGDLNSPVRTLKDERERAVITRALKESQWNVRQAARLLCISYECLLNKIRQYGLDP